MREKNSLCAGVDLLLSGQGEGGTTSVVEQGSSEVGTGPGLAKEGGCCQGVESKVFSQLCSHGDPLLSGEVVPPQRRAHGVGREFLSLELLTPAWCLPGLGKGSHSS